MLKRIALFVYKRLCVSGFHFIYAESVEADLMLLHPGERMDCLLADYYVNKIELILKILLVGAGLGCALKLSTFGGALGENGIRRGNFDGSAREMELVADDGMDRHKYSVKLSPRELTEEEFQDYVHLFMEHIDEYVLGNNREKNEITEDLCLDKEYEEYPFEIVWLSNKGEVIDCFGNVSEVTEEVAVDLELRFTYLEYMATETYTVTVVPIIRTREEQSYIDIQAFIKDSELDSRSEYSWNPPDEWNGQKLKWSVVREDNSWIIWISTPVIAVLVFLLCDKDLHSRLNKRREELLKDYPNIVYKLMLYVSAGMTIRGAMQKIGEEYEERKNKRRKEYKKLGNPGYEEIVVACRELHTGVSEGAVYERLGKRTGMREYIKLCSVLGQNLKRGSVALPERLKEEMERASAATLMQARKLGEQAGTKLLVPMVMMLAIIMTLIMIPAFGTI